MSSLAFNAAALQPGDVIVRDVKQTSRSGEVTEGTITVTVRAVDEAADRIESEQLELLGRVQRENVTASSLSYQRSLAKALAENLTGYCRDAGGEVEELALPIGNVRACKLATTLQDGVAGFRWFAAVGPTNVVKEVLRSEDRSLSETTLRAIRTNP